ncbi:MAG: DUF799 domain-containing protein [Azoarcus sp.]|jgi:hypothetical protein|nr:DUF799 domain-containing protein [Azoarcus sp.]
MNSLFSLFFPSIRAARTALAVSAAMLCCACATPVAQRDYTAFRESRPRSILVMPPVNRSPEIKAPITFLATATVPLAESGYYVIPVTLADETFKQNGVTVAEEAHSIELGKLREIFGADAALYVTITRFGTSYRVLSSVVEAAASSKLVDLRTGQELWSGQATVVWDSSSNNGGGLIGMLVSAIVSQIANTISDKSHDAGRAANYRMLSAGHQNSILFGPYHPKFGTD